MKAASPALIALLSSGDQFIMADLYTITLVGGSVLRYSAAPTALSANGYLFALGPKFERSKTKIVIGTQVDELEVRIYTEPTDPIGGTPFLEAAWQGQLDGALLQLERAFMPTYGDTSPGTLLARPARTAAAARRSSMRALVHEPMKTRSMPMSVIFSPPVKPM